MVQDSTIYYIWIGGSCDYGHKEPTNVSVPRETGETKGVKSIDQTCLGFALQEGGRRSQRAGGAAVVIEHDGSIISCDVISDLHTTEFRMMPFFGQNEQSYHFFEILVNF